MKTVKTIFRVAMLSALLGACQAEELTTDEAAFAPQTIEKTQADTGDQIQVPIPPPDWRDYPW